MKGNTLTLASLFFLMSILAASCGKDAPTNQDEKITLSFSIVGADLIETDEPYTATKSGDDEETTYVIGVYEFNVNTSRYIEYARGAFDSPENISIQVSKGKKYKFKVALFKDFFKSGEYLIVNSDESTLTNSADNKFTYEEGRIYSQLIDGLNQPFRNSRKFHAIFLGETFYGEISDFTPSQGTNISVNLSRVSSFLEVKVNGMTEGKVETISFAPNFSIEYPTTSYTTWITDRLYQDGKDSFVQHLRFQYVDSQGNGTRIVEQDFTFKRNYKKTIIINLTEATSSEFNSDFSINVSNSSLLDDEDQTFNVEI